MLPPLPQTMSQLLPPQLPMVLELDQESEAANKFIPQLEMYKILDMTTCMLDQTRDMLLVVEQPKVDMQLDIQLDTQLIKSLVAVKL